MNKKYILAIDQSTTATKIMLFDRTASLVARLSLPHEQIYPESGFVEHDPQEIFDNTRSGMIRILEENKTHTGEVAALSITNQRETAMIWDRSTGEPLHNAVVWQCQRGAPYCDELRDRGLEEMFLEKTGLIIDPYFSASKLRWIMNHVPDAKKKAEKGELLLGTMDTWLLWKLTGGRVHATDHSNACRTMLYNIVGLKWDEELMPLFDLHPSMFPECRYSDEIFGHTDPSILPGEPVPISGLLGDSHAALFGQHCFTPGMAKATYGTGSSIMMNIGREPLTAPKGLVTSIGFSMKGNVDYVYEGNIHSTGDTINWLVNELELIDGAGETEALATSVPSANGVYMVPAFVGLGAPYWDHQARATLSGISRDTRKPHVVRAVLESIAYQVRDLIDLMEKEGDIELKVLRVDGGPTRNNFLMQFQADMLNREVVRSAIEEISALGSASMAGLATGFWKDLDEILSLRKGDDLFRPGMKEDLRSELYKGWMKAVERTLLK